MRIGLQLCAAGISLLLAVSVCEAGATARGTHEILGSLGWDTFSVSDDETGEASLALLEFSPTYGYFFVDNVEAQFRSTVVSLHLDGELGSYRADYSATIWTPLVLVLAHAPVSTRYFPYLGIGFGGSWFFDSEGTETDATLVLPIVCAGGKMLVTENAAVNVELYYVHHENALYSEDLDANGFGLTLGLSLFLGPDARSEADESRWHPLDW